MLNTTSVAVRVEVVVEIAALTDKMVLLRFNASVDNAPLNTVSTSANETDALLNALDNDAVALPRVVVSAVKAVFMPAFTAERDGMAELLTDAIALMRVVISPVTPAFNDAT